ncbi:MAG: lytic transglycosylase domain-containing protein, partial [Desulfobacterales bacterium]
MKENSPIGTTNKNLVSWITTAIMVLLVLGLPLYEGLTFAKPVPEEAVPSQTETMPEKILPEKPMPLVQGLEAGRLYHSIIIEAANRHQVDPAIVKAIIMAESSYNPKAVSKKGAKGLMQLMPKTAAELGVKDSFNPVYNINGGVQYYKKMLNQFDGDVKLALAAYNAGSRKVKKYQGIPPFKATRFYIKKVFKYYQYYKKQVDIK